MIFSRGFKAGVMFFLASFSFQFAHAGDLKQPLPTGWKSLPLPAISGNFLGKSRPAIAMLVRYEDHGPYGLALVPNSRNDGASRIVATFNDIATNPPQLSVSTPGVFKPVCHEASECQPIKVETEAIVLCFGEASCELIYVDGRSFRKIFIID